MAFSCHHSRFSLSLYRPMGWSMWVGLLACGSQCRPTSLRNSKADIAQRILIMYGPCEGVKCPVVVDQGLVPAGEVEQLDGGAPVVACPDSMLSVGSWPVA